MKLLLKFLRLKLIAWLAGDDISVAINVEMIGGVILISRQDFVAKNTHMASWPIGDSMMDRVNIPIYKN